MKKLLVLPALAGLPLLAASPAAAATQSYRAQLTPLNNSGATGQVTMSLNGDELTVKIDASGLTPNAPHAQHIHGSPGGHNVCPGASADKNGDGILTTAEGVPSYGAIDVTLTTSGDTSAKSGLAIDRLPKADGSGNLHYSRTFAVPSSIAQNLGTLHVVQHGVDLNKDGKYDGSMKSELDPKLPEEATAPANCGRIVSASASAPSGGAATGAGGTSDGTSTGLVAFGGLVLLGAGAVARRATARA